MHLAALPPVGVLIDTYGKERDIQKDRLSAVFGIHAINVSVPCVPHRFFRHDAADAGRG